MKMARRRFPVQVFVPLIAAVLFPDVKSSGISHVYTFPPTMFHEQLNTSGTVQNLHIVKPPEIILRNSLLHNHHVNASHFPQLQRPILPQVHVIPTSPPPPVPPSVRRSYSPSPIPVLVPVNSHAPAAIPLQRGPMSHFTRNITPSSMTLLNRPVNPPVHPQQNSPFPKTANFLSSPFPKVNGTSSPFASDSPFNSFNEVDRFINFLPMDYENGQSLNPGSFSPPSQKRAATALPKTNAASRRADHGPLPRRNSTSTLKNIISSFHEKVSRIFMGPRRRGPKPMRFASKPMAQQHTLQRGNRNTNDLPHPGTIQEQGTQNFNRQAKISQTPTSDRRSFTAAINTVTQLLQQNQYIPMLGTRERVRALSHEESQLMDRRDRSRHNRGRQNKRRYPRKRRPHHRPPYDDDWPTKNYDDHDNDEYHNQKYQRHPKHFEDDQRAPNKDYSSSYKGGKNFKSFKPWKQQYTEDEDRYEDRYRGSGRKPVWHIESHETGSFQNPNNFRPHYYAKPHHHEKYREYSPESHWKGVADSDSFKPNRPFYTSFGKLKNWGGSGKKVKFHKIFDYDHGIVGSSDNFSTKLRHGASRPNVVKDDDARIPKIIINHHHNLPQTAAPSSFTFPSNAVLSYSPPVHRFHDEYYTGSSGGRGGRKKDYRSNEIADSFIINDYGKPPIPGFGFGGPTTGFNSPPTGFNSPPTGFNGPPTGFNSPPTGFNSPPTGFNSPPTGFNSPPTGFNGPPTGFNSPPTGFNSPPTGFNSPGFNSPPAGFGGLRSSVQHNGPPPPPPGIAASPQMGSHMVFDHFSQSMPSHFMQTKLPTSNHSPFVSGHPVENSMSYANTHFTKPMLDASPNGHIAPGFPSLGHQQLGPIDHYGKPSQMSNFPVNLHENSFPQHTPTEHSFPEGSAEQHPEELSPDFPPPDSAPFSPTNENPDSGFIPPFTPVPTPGSDINPTQGPDAPTSGESFFSSKRSQSKIPRQFDLKLTKSNNPGFEIPEKLINHPLAQQNPNPLRNYFDLDIPDREHYKKKKRKNQNPNHNRNNNDAINNPPIGEDHHRYNQQAASPSLTNNLRVDSSEFNYSTLPDNWRSFRPDPSHNKLPTFTHEDSNSKEMSSRMHKIRSSFNPKKLMKALISRLPRARLTEKSSGGSENEYLSGNRGHAKFTPYDAKSREDMSVHPHRKRRKSTKTPASIQDIINSDSSNHNKGVVIPYAGDDDDRSEFPSGGNNSNQKDLYENEGGASMASPVTVILGKGQSKKSSSVKTITPKSSFAKKQGENQHASNKMQTKMSNDGGEIDDDTLLGLHTFNVPVAAAIRMGEVDDVKKKK